MNLIPTRSGGDRPGPAAPVDADALADVLPIIGDIRENGWDAVIRQSVRLADADPFTSLVYTPEDLSNALDRIDHSARGVLERTAVRIASFARAQCGSIGSVSVEVPGGKAGDRLIAVDAAGCYAPGGRYPLPSSVLMTAVTAREAGVGTVWVASPRPTDVTLAAAAIAGADGLLAVGGAQAIAALAFGAGDVPACDVVVGPGNRWVTAAKYAVSASVGIDLIAGPSELVVIATPGSDAELVAADLLAQAEHDVAALPILVVWANAEEGEMFTARVRAQLEQQLVDLPTADVARVSLESGWTIEIADADDVVAEVDRLAPEHLQLHAGAELLSDRLSRFGGLFVGARTAEVFGDYGIGPNHTLPTGGSARYSAGLSVETFLRRPTWIEMDGSVSGGNSVAADAVALARLEGLEAHARAAERRLRALTVTRE
ncbi:MAG: histidinol dehydrogenase [Gemmatimonadetes bacterium]|nr:histidinol dehydrogenase [Gemmatimonadota bacterium]